MAATDWFSIDIRGKSGHAAKTASLYRCIGNRCGHSHEPSDDREQKY